MNGPSVEEWLSAILLGDPMIFESAYWGLRPAVAEAVTKIIEALSVFHDAYLRGKFFELLGESGDTKVLEALEAELHGSEQPVREWASLSIEENGESWQEWARQDELATGESGVRSRCSRSIERPEFDFLGRII